MPLDPQAQELLIQMEASGFPPLHELTPTEARDHVNALPLGTGPEVGKVEDLFIAVPDHSVPVRVYTPEGPGPFPALVWFHGGGWVVGNVARADGVARHLSHGSGCVVISVDYRLAPDTKFPGPLEDCFAVTRWVAVNAAALNVDPARIAVGGDSAGGNLTAAVTLMARDRGGPEFAFQLLVYPVTDMDFDTQSYLDNAEGYLLTRDTMIWFWDHYLAEQQDGANPYASPLRADDLTGLPPALVITAEYDPLRDEGEAYAEKLTACGVPTELSRYDGMVHGFFEMYGAVDRGVEALVHASKALRAALGA